MSLKTHLARLVADASLRRCMGAASRRLAEAHSLERIAAQYERLYEQVTAAPLPSFPPAWMRCGSSAVGGAGNQRTCRARAVGTYHLMAFEEEGEVCGDF